MMIKLGKLLAIFLTVASIAFVGFAVATTFGKPTFDEVLAQEYFNGYRISKTAGPEGQWVATRGSDEGNVASSKIKAEVIAKVMDEILQKNTQETQELTSREPDLEKRIAELTTAQFQSVEALKKYEEELRTRLAALRTAEANLGTQVVTATGESQKLESQIIARRGDVLRLEEQVAELKSDTFRLTQIERQLRDLLNQMRGNLELAEHRQNLLSGGDATYSPPPVEAQATPEVPAE